MQENNKRIIKLKELLKSVEIKLIHGNQEIDISGIAYDSRKVEKGYLFICVRGEKLDGHEFNYEAVQKGAVAILGEEEVESRAEIARIIVSNARIALAQISANFYQNPSLKLKVIGVGGTDGKTTTTYLIESVLKGAGFGVGVIGTINYRWGERVLPAGLTSPESLDLQRMLSEMVAINCKYAVLEVSSHAVSQHRIWATNFDTGIFTNFGRDHLDYHKTLSSYLEAELRLIRSLEKDKLALINIDDRYGRRLKLQTSARVMTYGTKRGAHIRASKINSTLSGLSFHVDTPTASCDVQMKLIGKVNMYNALAAIGVGIEEGLNIELICDALRRAEPVPGRFQIIDEGQDFKVMVDFAHTPQAFLSLLQMAGRMTKGSIIIVFGAAGERDRGKRSLMGRIASRYGSYSIITSDNPYGEDPMQIIEDIKSGFRRRRYSVVIDRLFAIKEGLSRAKGGDVVIIAGKGHEDYQVFGDRVVAFNDCDVVRRLLRDKNANG
ncbi:MAG: UDP-N-acetylmuramoyl-L-alanyl-D-glutamate--2,6-diaminopimelate ligase [Syntrophomonadaceae bacterium]|nr:UDP-N-acetylmuramoyl-L-alanyl-D-glutamate--2,6-diaminopimelate ligase [Bacillota bacterium]